jgi:hypothetical protein
MSSLPAGPPKEMRSTASKADIFPHRRPTARIGTSRFGGMRGGSTASSSRRRCRFSPWESLTTVDEGLYVARQPILDSRNRVYGYELLYRAAQSDQS